MKKTIFVLIVGLIICVISIICFNKKGDIDEENLKNNYNNIKFEVKEDGKYEIYDENGNVKFENVEEDMLRFYEDNPDFEPIE